LSTDPDQAQYFQRLRHLIAALPGGEEEFLRRSQKPGFAAGLGLAAIAPEPPERRAKHVDDLVGLAGTPRLESPGDRDEAAGTQFLNALREGLSAGNALWLEPEVLARWETRAAERGTTALGLMGAMFNTFKLAEDGLTRW
jgi:hypothetical protein